MRGDAEGVVGILRLESAVDDVAVGGEVVDGAVGMAKPVFVEPESAVGVAVGGRSAVGRNHVDGVGAFEAVGGGEGDGGGADGLGNQLIESAIGIVSAH